MCSSGEAASSGPCRVLRVAVSAAKPTCCSQALGSDSSRELAPRQGVTEAMLCPHGTKEVSLIRHNQLANMIGNIASMAVLAPEMAEDQEFWFTQKEHFLPSPSL